jgi:hypothetical protein
VVELAGDFNISEQAQNTPMHIPNMLAAAVGMAGITMVTEIPGSAVVQVVGVVGVGPMAQAVTEVPVLEPAVVAVVHSMEPAAMVVVGDVGYIITQYKIDLKEIQKCHILQK